MQIYYINLARRTDRRAFMEEQFARLGLEATRIEAVTPVSIDARDLATFCDSHRGRHVPPVVLACSLSHVAALESFLESGTERAAIFEDDAILSSGLPDFLTALAADPPPFDLLRIETYRDGVRVKEPIARYGPIDLYRPFSWEPGSAGYVVTRTAAARIVTSRAVRCDGIDRALFHPFTNLGRHLTLGQAIPALCQQTQVRVGSEQASLGSDIRRASKPSGAVRPAIQRRLLDRARTAIHNELVIGGQQTLHQLLGARKCVIPFSG